MEGIHDGKDWLKFSFKIDLREELVWRYCYSKPLLFIYGSSYILVLIVIAITGTATTTFDKEHGVRAFYYGYSVV